MRTPIEKGLGSIWTPRLCSISNVSAGAVAHREHDMIGLEEAAVAQVQPAHTALPAVAERIERR